MRLPSGLRKLDDRVLGAKGGTASAEAEPAPRTERVERTTRGAGPARTGGGLSAFLAVVWRVAKLVLLALGLVVLLAAVLVLLPANEDNVIVRNVLSLGKDAAGPFEDVLTVDDPDRMRVYNYGIGALAYFLAAAFVGRLPTGGTRKA